jgi:hypothetical protein
MPRRGRTGGAGITRAVVTAVEVEAEAEVPSESAGTNTLIAETDHAVAVEIVSGIESLGDNTSRRDTTEA